MNESAGKTRGGRPFYVWLKGEGKGREAEVRVERTLRKRGRRG